MTVDLFYSLYERKNIKPFTYISSKCQVIHAQSYFYFEGAFIHYFVSISWNVRDGSLHILNSHQTRNVETSKMRFTNNRLTNLLVCFKKLYNKQIHNTKPSPLLLIEILLKSRKCDPLGRVDSPNLHHYY